MDEETIQAVHDAGVVAAGELNRMLDAMMESYADDFVIKYGVTKEFAFRAIQHGAEHALVDYQIEHTTEQLVHETEEYLRGGN